MVLQDKFDLLYYSVEIYDGQLSFTLTDPVDFTTTLILKDDNNIDTWELELYMGAFRCVPSAAPSVGVYLQDSLDPTVTWSLRVADQQFYIIVVTEVGGRVVYLETGQMVNVMSLNCSIEGSFNLNAYLPPTLISL